MSQTEPEAVIAACVERCVVITHGTDTMTQTAEALLGVAGKTIVLTGALSPARFAKSDATFNVGMAFAAGAVKKDTLNNVFVRLLN